MSVPFRGCGRQYAAMLAALGIAAGSMSGPASAAPVAQYAKTLTLGDGLEWRFRPLLVDLNRDGHLDLVATARLVEASLHMWLGDGKGAFRSTQPTWTDIGYGAIAAGDINGDKFPDIVVASHFARVQTLLSDGKGTFTERIIDRDDGHVAAQLADLNGDRHLDLVLLGFEKAGVEIYFGDGSGKWTLHKTLVEAKPNETMPGRDLVLGDLNQDGHLDIVAAFQRSGVYIYYGAGRGEFSGGLEPFASADHNFESVALGDVNNDRKIDIVINGTTSERDRSNGPDVYLGDGRQGWTASANGAKALKFATAGIGLGDLDQDGNLDLVAAGNDTTDFASGYGLFWFKGDGKGGWQLIGENGLPSKGLSIPHSVTLADLDGDRIPEIVALNGGLKGSITIWKRQ
jgi:hypothetical protein